MGFDKTKAPLKKVTSYGISRQSDPGAYNDFFRFIKILTILYNNMYNLILFSKEITFKTNFKFQNDQTRFKI